MHRRGEARASFLKLWIGAGDATASGHESFAAGLVDWNDRRISHQPPKLGPSPTPLPSTGITHSRGLVDHAIAASSAMMPEMVDAVVPPGMAIMSTSPTEHHAGHGFRFSIFRQPLVAASIMFLSSGDRDERAGQSADVGGRHDAALLHLIVEHGERRWCPVPTCSRPIFSSTSPTESPAGVGARERSMMPNGMPRRRMPPVPN